MGAALERHDEALHEAVESRGGQVFKTLGDGVCAGFEDPAAAVLAAVAGQRAVAGIDVGAAPLRVRMAIHAGVAESRGGDWFGPEVNRVARLLAAGHGGQVLVSGPARELARGALPPEVGFRELGRHHLRDLELPIAVWQLLHPELADDFPPLRSVAARRHNLPAPLTAFVGRERERAAILARLDRGRLVTLVGPGGSGKTRLAIEIARERSDALADGAWLAHLDALEEPAQAVAAVAEALGVARIVEATGVRPLALAVAEREALLVLDNCEHLLAASAEIAAALLAAGPSLHVLATSREPLGIPGESVQPLAPLPVPDPVPAGRSPEVADLARIDAVRLFVDRARAVRPDFELTDANAAAVAEICRRLDGLPLALELSAAEVAALAPADIAARLDRRFRLLERPTGGPRHRTLSDTIDWSHERLSAPEQRLFRRLGVFAGGWSLEAAEAIGGDAATLARLVRKSLVTHADDAGASRYSFLESIREYALARLEEAGEGEAVARLHRDAFLALAERASEEIYGPDQAHAYAWFEREEPNLRAAIGWSLERGEVDAALTLAQTLYPAWLRGGPDGRREGAHLLARAIERSGDLSLRSRGYYMLSSLLRRIDPAQSRAAAYACLAEAERSGIARRRIGGLESVAYIEMEEGRDPSPRLEEAMRLARAEGHEGILSQTANFAGEAARLAGDLERARAYYEESLELSRKLGDRVKQAFPLTNLAHVELERGNVAAAVRLWRESLSIAWETQSPASVATAIEGLGAAAAGSDATRAARLYGAAARLREETRTSMTRADRAVHEDRLSVVRAALGEPEFRAAWGAGQALDLATLVSREAGVEN